MIRRGLITIALVLAAIVALWFLVPSLLARVWQGLKDLSPFGYTVKTGRVREGLYTLEDDLNRSRTNTAPPVDLNEEETLI